MSAFSGRQGNGAMKRRREEKRLEAEARNIFSTSHRWKCGHRSSSADHSCRVA